MVSITGPVRAVVPITAIRNLSNPGVQTHSMSAEVAQAMVGAAMLSFLVYPTLMNMLLSKAAAAAAKKD